ncbi:MAG TPA: hypothetical protein VFS20_22965 [Longimicrobium sp.]|nr:hypothetical protein [Longimicrobium sp.]
MSVLPGLDLSGSPQGSVLGAEACVRMVFFLLALQGMDKFIEIWRSLWPDLAADLIVTVLVAASVAIWRVIRRRRRSASIRADSALPARRLWLGRGWRIVHLRTLLSLRQAGTMESIVERSRPEPDAFSGRQPRGWIRFFRVLFIAVLAAEWVRFSGFTSSSQVESVVFFSVLTAGALWLIRSHRLRTPWSVFAPGLLLLMLTWAPTIPEPGQKGTPASSPSASRGRGFRSLQLRNVGSVAWVGRYLCRIDGEPRHCVRIPDTPPGKVALVHVLAQEDSIENWKMADRGGRWYYPELLPVRVEA